MQVYEIIRKKRDGKRLSEEEILFFIEGYTTGDIPDYQASAMAMAIYFQGLSDQELMAWTKAMLYSGDTLDFSDIEAYKVDKHSTGGVGDKTSLILAPIVAAAGVYVPMISGRGLGHTGGTLDKLESIPGFDVGLSAERFSEVLHSCGVVLAGQTGDIVPADRKLYALRDVTATVDSIPLIASSIMSKKLAEGIDGLVLDVKFGSGAFMKDLTLATMLARTLVAIGAQMGKEVVALLTDMNQPLGTHIGNSLEVIESCEVLQGRVQNDLSELSFQLAAEMLLLGKAADSLEEAMQLVQDLVNSGAAFRKFQEITAAQGGDPRALEDYSLFPKAKGIIALSAQESGIIQSIHCEQIGRLAVELGAGRQKVTDPIDPAVGFILNRKVGDKVEAGDQLMTIYYNDEEAMQHICQPLRDTFVIADEEVEPITLIVDRIEATPSP
ncbi:MAG: thymidine phosphorylase [Deltaproteobacteria bacterium]|nr:thymidine phosphorylase [Deltaproteobacteria bacterium]MBU51101.1 thymidine phosphorylase [Deltaproteobacteria bacterium]|tara:strand:- start:3483 stop:4802 length:1320 start_codon:yes stop_codon:yes gene_type:complete